MNIVHNGVGLFRHYFLSHREPGCTLGDIDLDTDIKVSWTRLRHHKFSRYEILHYSILIGVFAFAFFISPASPLIKLPIVAALVVLLLIPFTGQFFLNGLPILAWLALFFNASKIPVSWKPVISVKFLPAMETILYGDNLLNVLAETNSPVLDIMAWLPYGIIHFASPFFVALFVFLFTPPTALRSFGFAFGYMNLVGVLIQLLFPAAPPWYKNLHGLEPANYSMDGSPGGLGRIDALFHLDMYTTTFSNSPLVFGAFPSLHSACAVIDVLFLSWVFPRYKFVWWGYASILWWSTMYLTHHYFIDLILGAALAFLAFTYVKHTTLPVIDYTKFCRWSYTSVDLYDVQKNDPLSVFVPLNDDMENNLSASRAYSNYELSSLPRSRDPSRASSRNPSPSHAHPSLLAHDHVSEDPETDNSASSSVFDSERFDEETHVSLAPSNASLNASLNDFTSFPKGKSRH